MASKPFLRPHAVVVPVLCIRRDKAEFNAVTIDLSTAGLRLRTTLPPRAGEPLTCAIRGVGTVEVRVTSTGNCDFVVRITGLDPSPSEVAIRLVHLARDQDRSLTVARLERRIVPAVTAVEVTLADGTRVPARILNLSESGVALALDASLALGDAILVGLRRARVVRRIADGVGAEFVEFPVEATADGSVVSP